MKNKLDDFTKTMMLYKGMRGGQPGGPSPYDMINPFYHLKKMLGAPTSGHPTLKGIGSLLGLYLMNKNRKKR